MSLRIAMWSGPRNISTALLRSFGSRADTAVCDEPLYAYYLAERPTLAHPGRDEIVARCETDWRAVAAFLTGPIPGGKRVFYQKHMAHHLLPAVGREWLEGLVHAFLIRDPREMLLSLVKVTPRPSVADTGLPQQLELFRAVARRGELPPVIDARDVLLDPAGLLARLCARLGLDFDPAMLRWEPGLRASDGIWAPHWYGEVARSTGFDTWRPRAGELPSALAPVLEACQPLYDELHAQRLSPADS